MQEKFFGMRISFFIDGMCPTDWFLSPIFVRVSFFSLNTQWL